MNAVLQSKPPYSRTSRKIFPGPYGAPGVLLAGLIALGLAWTGHAQSSRVVITNQPGYTITWDGNNGGFSNPEPGAQCPDNIALATYGTVAFGSSEYGTPHFIANVNDGWYGNSSSWISDFTIPDPNPFIGLAFAQSVMITNIAWSRDNGDDAEMTPEGPYTDRCVGTYTLQVTTVSSPGVNTAETGNPATGWVTIGTVTYTAGTDTKWFAAYLRHRFDVAANGNPIAATGLRIKVSDPNLDLDEIDVNDPPDPTPPVSQYIDIQSTTNYFIGWDGNDGKFSTTASPAPAPPNRALASQGTKAFGSSEYGQGVHYITNVIDGLYGNSHSWLSDITKPDTNAFIGLNFGALVNLKNVAWGRDNGDDPDGQEFQDRALGTYILQFTRITNPDATTPDTGDATTGWETIGTLTYKAMGTPFTPWLRHRYDVSTAAGDQIAATGIRIKVSDGNIDIDEIEVNVHAALELDLSTIITIAPESGYAITWDGNDGDFYNPNAGARCPDNLALTTHGASAFGSSELGFGVHFIPKIIDGFYGNASSWISANGLGGTTDPDPYIGVAFPTAVDITSIAWSRDNGDTTEAGCGGTCMDRSLGTYTLQVTTVANPGTNTVDTGNATTGWATIGTITYLAAASPAFNPYLRHQYEVSANGQPIRATGLRVKVSDGYTDLDELEVNPMAEVVAPPISDLITVQGLGSYSMTWDGNDGEYSIGTVGAAAPDNVALASKGATAFGSSEYGTPHFITNVIDGLYGNSHSWISAFTVPDTNPYVGVKFSKTVQIRNVAWGRDNGDNSEGPSNPNTDRCLGTYTLQVTSVANPGVDTQETGNATTGWATVGIAEYKATFPTLFNPYLRHRFAVGYGGARIAATGIRIKVSDPNLCIDEIEVNPAGIVDNNVLNIIPTEGYTIGWDGNDGEYSSTNATAGPPDNDALAANGAVAIGSSQLDLGVHFITNVNDGLYGNPHSWIGGDDDPLTPAAFVGIKFPKTTAVSSIAWGRDNTKTLTDRCAGTYNLEVTTIANPGVDTQETGDPTTGWVSIGTIAYSAGTSSTFHPSWRHSWDVAFNGQPINATAIRILVPSTGAAAGTDIDEIEVNTRLPEVTMPPILSISLQGNNANISWTESGTLQSADDLAGPWADVTDATNPMSVTISTAGHKFYRVRQ